MRWPSRTHLVSPVGQRRAPKPVGSGGPAARTRSALEGRGVLCRWRFHAVLPCACPTAWPLSGRPCSGLRSAGRQNSSICVPATCRVRVSRPAFSLAAASAMDCPAADSRCMGIGGGSTGCAWPGMRSAASARRLTPFRADLGQAVAGRSGSVECRYPGLPRSPPLPCSADLIAELARPWQIAVGRIIPERLSAQIGGRP